MAARELELTRSADERRTYVLGDLGAVRLGSWRSRGAELVPAGAAPLAVSRRGFWKTVTEATDAAGSVVGNFAGRGFRRGGELTWRGRALALRPASAWKERYALADGERELAVLEGRGWGSKRPVTILVEDDRDPALLLFAAYVVRSLAEDASAGVTAATAGGAVAGSS